MIKFRNLVLNSFLVYNHDCKNRNSELKINVEYSRQIRTRREITVLG